MYKPLVWPFGLVAVISAFPLETLKEIAERNNFDDIDNYLPRYDEIINYQYPINNFEDEDLFVERKAKNDSNKVSKINPSVQTELTTSNTSNSENATSAFNNSTTVGNVTDFNHRTNATFDKVELTDPDFEGNRTSEETESNRLPRQELNDTKSDPEFESQEEGSSEEEGNMITGLISAFLGGFSRPDGSIDLEAIVGLLGSLSTQNDDGSYDFQGLTDILRGFFGGGGDDGGGSDIGAFLGGLLGATIKGVANPPGAKGAGIFTGKVVAGILPALSAPPPADDNNNKGQGSDSGGFLAGLIKTVLSSSSGSPQGGGGGSNLFKIIFQLITSILSASSKSH